MASLEELRVATAPLAFAQLANAHNALVDMLARMQGTNGIKVTISSGNIVVEQVPLEVTEPPDTDDFLTQLLAALQEGEVVDYIKDQAILAVLDRLPTETVDACGIGPKEYFVRP